MQNSNNNQKKKSSNLWNNEASSKNVMKCDVFRSLTTVCRELHFIILAIEWTYKYIHTLFLFYFCLMLSSRANRQIKRRMKTKKNWMRTLGIWNSFLKLFCTLRIQKDARKFSYRQKKWIKSLSISLKMSTFVTVVISLS